ncbi:nuclear pore complex protein Nup133-like [Littorina saxatilis]|uniref:Nuclear pore complex protein Nup133 n=1 Tax=Littorina saxatilis TaxID=31220 RepID=A0AAN9BKB7_9CAEN
MFSPRGPATRSQNSPFTPSRKGTPGKRGFSTPRRARDNRSQVGTRSLQVSQILDDTSRHRVESFGVPLPVLITEALTLADRSTEVTVKIDPSGWAWLVGGRKLFVWRCNPTTTRGIQCKELTLPPSDLAHSAGRVCVLAPVSGENQPTACVAVSPEGVIRYWPNIAYEASTSEISAELKGEECACVVNFQPHGCLLATTTSSLLLLKPSHGQNSITCIALKTAQGMFSGISRRMSSFIFGATPAQTAGAPLQALVAGVEDEEDETRPFYVLSDTHLQKWMMSTFSPEKLIYQADALRLVKDALARRVWDQESVNLPQLLVWLLDLQLTRDGVMILAAGTNLEASPDLYYVVALLSTDEEEAPKQLDKLTLLDYRERYDVSREEELLSYHLLVPTLTSQEALIYCRRLIFMLPVNDSQPADRMDLQNSADQLIGAGICDGKAVFFSSAHGMFCVAQNRGVEDSIMDEVGQDSLLRSEMSTMGFNMSQVAELSQCDDKLSRLKACFISSLSGNQADVKQMLEDLFPGAVMDALPGDGGREMDRLVTELSCELIDDYPTADPRWAESSRYDGGSSSSLIIVQQLRDKVRAHDYFRSFLKKFHLWEKLNIAPVRDGEMCTRLLLCEHVEKLEAAISLREQDAEPTKIVDVCIRRLLKERGTPVPHNLNPEDAFFREVSKVQDIGPALLDYEMEQLSSGITSRQCSHLIVTISGLLQTMVSAALVYRQTKADDYQLQDDQMERMPEYIPWTSTSGARGMRTVLSRQITLTAERGIPETQDVETRGTMFQQLMGLADIQLDCYSSQLESLRPQPHQSERYAQLKKKYEDERRKMIEPLLEYEQFDRAASLAEKYFDFDILIRICDVTDSQDRLQRYVAQFADQGFSQYLFNWYLKEGKRGRLLSQPFAQNPDLRRFLASDNTRYLSWLHQIGAGDFSGVHQTLVELARAEQIFLAKRKTLLSLSKLAALASDDSPELVEPNVEAINEELSQIDLQETLPKEAIQKVGLDPDNMRVLSASELIRLYAGDENLMATEVDYKKALDLLLYIDQAECPDEYEELKLFIWCQAILRDSDRWMDPSEKDPIKIRNETLFFRTVDLIYNEGDDLGVVLPSTETLLDCHFLGDLRNNKHFQFLLKAGYEIISNVLLSGQ